MKWASLSRASVQVTLPYRAPKGAPPVWTRTSGNISLMIQPGYFTQQRSERAANGRQKLVSETVSLRYPYGSYPRLMLAWIGKEIMAKKKRGEFSGTVDDRRISLGNSLSEFMYNLGIPMATGGKRGTMTLVRQQMIRLFSATIAIVQNKSTPTPNQTPNHEPLSIDRVGYLLADQLSTWWDPMQPGQGSMFESFVVLSEPFFNELVNRPVPVDYAGAQGAQAVALRAGCVFLADLPVLHDPATHRRSPGKPCRCSSARKPRASASSAPYSARHSRTCWWCIRARRSTPIRRRR